jgi:23S rRNA pseudouridine1911/1915/1917 synthase
VSHDRVITLPAAATGRLDTALLRLDLGLSRRALKEAFVEGRVHVGGRRVPAAFPATGGLAVVLVGVPVLDRPELDPPLAIDVVFVDAALIVVDKPAGVPAYARRAHESGTVAGAVLARFPDLAGVGDLKLAPGLCHRLDRETSGLLLFARTPEAFATVRAGFRGRRVHKLYQAVLGGHLEGDGVVEVPLGRVRGRARRMVAVSGRSHGGLRKTWPARTRWRAIAGNAARTLVELTLETGVTHQARVHMLCLGHPIVGDLLYGGPPHLRLLLHALELGLDHPVSGERLLFKSTKALDLDS